MSSDFVRFTNFKYKKSKYYFLYICEIKAYGIGYFFKLALSKILKISINNIEFITIAPDIFEQYNYENVVIINHEHMNKSKRLSSDIFAKLISQNSYLDSIIDNILENQNELYIYMFESNPFMTLDKKKNVFLVGPDKDLVSLLSDKIELYKRFSTVVPMANYNYTKGLKNLKRYSKEMLKKYDKIFVSLEKSAAGSNSIVANDIETIYAKFKNEKESTFLLTEFIKHKSDPTTLAVVINENEVFVAGVADQNIDGTKFKGSTFPSKCPQKIQSKLIDLTKQIGREIAKIGYRGIFGCDFIVTDDNKIYFIEINPRKQGTTMEFCCTLQNRLKKSAPNLPEIEYYAVMRNSPPPNIGKFKKNVPLVCWGTYNYKLSQKRKTHYYLPQNSSEIEMFKNLYKKKVKKEFVILEHVGQDFFVDEGTFLARVVATGQNYKDVESGIVIGKKIIEYTINSEV